MTTLTDKEKQRNWLEVLSKHGLRISAAQKALVAVLCTAENPLSADDVQEAVQRIRPKTGRATVYRFLDKLTALGLLQRIHGYRNCNTYFRSFVPYQAVVVCTQCGKVTELENSLQNQVFEVIETAANDLDRHHITSCHLQLLGTCIACQTEPT